MTKEGRMRSVVAAVDIGIDCSEKSISVSH